jgi:hypothetical protein
MHHSASTLCYRLLDGLPCLEPFRILAAQTVAWRSWRTTFYVLGASHAVCLHREDAQITELLTCLPPDRTIPALAELAADAVRETCIDLRGLTCRVRLTPFALTEGDALRESFAEANQLAISYPASHGEPTPITRLGWRITGGQLSVETVHTYPEEGRGVRSRTLFISEEAEL